MITFPESSDIDATLNMFCGICCVPDLESDSLDSLADDFDTITTAIHKGPLHKMDTAPQPNSTGSQVSVTHEPPIATIGDVGPQKAPVSDTETEYEKSVAASSSIRDLEMATDNTRSTATSGEVQRLPSPGTKSELETIGATSVDYPLYSDQEEDKPSSSGVHASLNKLEAAEPGASEVRIVENAPSENANLTSTSFRDFYTLYF